MGRRRVHTEATAVALLDAAEAIAARDGLDGLTVRRVADEASTTTRAVYSSLGSKERMLALLGVRGFDLLGAEVAALPNSDDPTADLVAAGVVGFRRWALAHPALFRVGFLLEISAPREPLSGIRPAAANALRSLHQLIRRVETAGGLGGRTLEEATWQFDSLCEGLVLMELRGVQRSDDEAVLSWADALTALVSGWRAVDIARSPESRAPAR
jgi:AcrR family transcriptional regulator